MKHFLFLLMLLIGLPTHAGVYARNDDSDINNNVNISVTNEWVGGLLVPQLAAVLAIPPRVATQYHVVRLCHDGTALAEQPWIAAAPFFEVRAQGVATSCAFGKIVSAWGTLLTATAPHPTELFRAIQTDRHFQFHGDYEFDDGCSVSPGCASGGVWLYRGAKGCWPVGLASAVYFRLEARQFDSFGLAQISVLGGNNVVEGTANEGNMGFRTQVKGLTRNDQPEASVDHVRMVIPPGPREGLWAFFTSQSRGTVHCSGFELKPN
jgi:hypothetical protein